MFDFNDPKIFAKVTPLTLEAAIEAINEAMSTSLSDGPLPATKTFTQRVKEFFQVIKNKIMAFFNHLKAKIVGDIEMRMKEIKGKEQAILNFSGGNTRLEMSKYLTAPRIKYTVDLLYKSCKKFDLNMVRVRSHDMIGIIIKDFTGFFVDDNGAAHLYEAAYGRKEDIQIRQLSPKLVLDQFQEAYKSATDFTNFSRSIMRMMDDIERMIVNGTAETSSDQMNDASKFASVTLKAANMFVKVEVARFNELYHILKHMAHN